MVVVVLRAAATSAGRRDTGRRTARVLVRPGAVQRLGAVAVHTGPAAAVVVVVLQALATSAGRRGIGRETARVVVALEAVMAAVMALVVVVAVLMVLLRAAAVAMEQAVLEVVV